MTNPKVAIVGYGTIGQRLADGVARQKDMELIGVSDVAPTLPVRALIIFLFLRMPGFRLPEPWMNYLRK